MSHSGIPFLPRLPILNLNQSVHILVPNPPPIINRASFGKHPILASRQKFRASVINCPQTTLLSTPLPELQPLPPVDSSSKFETMETIQLNATDPSDNGYIYKRKESNCGDEDIFEEENGNNEDENVDEKEIINEEDIDLEEESIDEEENVNEEEDVGERLIIDNKEFKQKLKLK
jgi:hypothetical protein